MEDAYEATFTYGTHKSAMPPVFKYVMDHAGFSLQFFTKHEIVTRSYDFPGTESDETITMQYTFDDAGYPKTGSDGTTTFKYEY
ncbi:MAG TPA: hypothetical protein VHK69_09290, partial [Chitinophagaceae bacterium]|nr:hypothetical protein [Chitinophagaceae bacterium]